MEHGNDKNMLFYFLRTREYNQDSGQLGFDMGYDLGDYNATIKWKTLARECAQILRARLAGVFDDDGNIIDANPIDTFGRMHKEKPLNQ